MSRPTMLMLLLCFTLRLSAATPEEPASADAVIRQYMQIALPESGPYGPTRGERIDSLERLAAMPEQAVPAVSAALSSATQLVHRVELLEELGRIPTRPSADVLVRYLTDSDREVRRQAVQSLRLLASRIERRGGGDVPKGPDFPPKVEGLVPHLIEAAGDECEENRELALFALADTRDPLAAAELGHRLHDSAARVRFTAACLLSEFGDDSGLPDLKVALRSLTTGTRSRDVHRYFDAELLLASFHRITGKTLGEIPLNPLWVSSMPGPEKAAAAYDALLEKWAAWWARQEKSLN